MTVRCKFICKSVTHTIDGGVINLEPVVHGSVENDLFFKWTPYGKLEIGTVNKEALGQFVPGNTYYIDITNSEEA